MIDYDKIYDLQLEVSSLCNARCVMCSRRVSGGVKNPTFKETYLTLQNIKDWFTSDFLNQINRIGMCGNYGDAMTNPELISIVEYIISVNPNIRFTMNTNGSGRDESFWIELGKLFKGRGEVIFSVDGLEDTNWIYRRGTHWDKIMSSMKAYISTGAKSSWDYLVFKHNQHQIDDAKRLAKNMGVTNFFQKKAFGFHDGEDHNRMDVYRSDGKFEYSIMAPLEEVQGVNKDPRRNTQGLGKNWLSGKKKTSTGYISDIKRQLANVENTTKTLHWSYGGYERDKFTDHDIKLSKTNIRCQAAEEHSIFVDHNGIVVPCCFIAAFYPGDGKDISQPIKEFLEKDGIETISLKHNSLEDIIDGRLFTTGWVESFNNYDIYSGKRLKACSIFCGETA